MDDTREGLSDIDRMLARALDVAPSPEFTARVRQRIASEPAAASLWRGWWIALPAAAAIAVAAVGLAMWSTRGQPAPQVLSARSLPLEPLRPAVVHPGRPEPAAGRSIPASRSRVASISPVRTGEPEVLVPAEEIEMYRRLMAAAQNVPHAVLLESPRDIVSVGLITEITIDPIKIDLIVPRVSGEGDRQ